MLIASRISTLAGGGDSGPNTTRIECSIPWATSVGIRAATAINPSVPTVIDWGDGTSDTVTGDISSLYHDYSAEGTYVFEISDNISSFNIKQQTYITRILNISSNVTSIPSNGLSQLSNLSYVYAGSSGQLTLGDSAFYASAYNTTVTAATFDFSGRTISVIPRNCFNQCKRLVSFACPKGLTEIQQSAFNSAFQNATGNASIDIPEGVTTIGDWCFDWAKGLSEVSFPSTLLSIGQQAFEGCDILSKITSKSMTAPTLNPFSWGSSYYAGKDTASSGTNRLYVPTGSTGYNTGYWLDPLQNSSKCGFTLVEV